MKISLAIIVSILLTLSFGAPQKEGAAYIQEAIREIQQRQLIPPNSQIYNVSIRIALSIRKRDFFCITGRLISYHQLNRLYKAHPSFPHITKRNWKNSTLIK